MAYRTRRLSALHRRGSGILSYLLVGALGLVLIGAIVDYSSYLTAKSRQEQAIQSASRALSAFTSALVVWAELQDPAVLGSVRAVAPQDLINAGLLPTNWSPDNGLGHSYVGVVTTITDSDGKKALGTIAATEFGTADPTARIRLGLTSDVRLQAFKNQIALRVAQESRLSGWAGQSGTAYQAGFAGASLPVSTLLPGVSAGTEPLAISTARVSAKIPDIEEVGQDSIQKAVTDAVAYANTIRRDFGTVDTSRSTTSATLRRTNDAAQQIGIVALTPWAPTADPLVPSTDPDGWSACSTLCGTGTQTRMRRCISINGEYRDLRECGLDVNGTLQTETRACTKVCGFRYGAWSSCSGGTGNWNTSGWSACTASAWWVAGDWGGCSASCGGGTQSRNVYCATADATQVRTVWCDPVANSGSQTRSGSCVNEDDLTINDSFCGTIVTTQACTPGTNICPGGTQPSATTTCQASCVAGWEPTGIQSCNTQPCGLTPVAGTNVFAVGSEGWDTFANTHAVWVMPANDNSRLLGESVGIIRGITINNEGWHTFYYTADDSFTLDVNGVRYVDNDMLHHNLPPGTGLVYTTELAQGIGSVSIYLSRGRHQLSIFGKNQDVADIGTWEFNPAGIALQVIGPDSAQVFSSRDWVGTQGLTCPFGYQLGADGYCY